MSSRILEALHDKVIHLVSIEKPVLVCVGSIEGRLHFSELLSGLGLVSPLSSLGLQGGALLGGQRRPEIFFFLDAESGELLDCVKSSFDVGHLFKLLVEL